MTGKSPISATEEQRSGLIVLAGSRDRGEADRARAVLLTLAGWTSPKIAEAFGVREDTVHLWRSAFMGCGIDALKASVAPGPAPVKSETALRVVTPLLEAQVDGADVLLQPAHHDGAEVALADLHAAQEPLRIENFQQRREAVGVAVVRRGGQEQPMLKMRRQVAHGAGESAVDGVAGIGGRRGVVRFVEDQQALGADGAGFGQPGAQIGRVGFIDQQPVRDQEAVVRQGLTP